MIMVTRLKIGLFRAAELTTLFLPAIIGFNVPTSLAAGFIYLPSFTILLAFGLMKLDKIVVSQLKSTKQGGKRFHIVNASKQRFANSLHLPTRNTFNHCPFCRT
jgi:hypothetical protein